MTKSSHGLSCSLWVRWWLKNTIPRRLTLVFLFTILYVVVAGILVGATKPTATFDNPTPSSPWAFLLWLAVIPIVFVIVDAIWDAIATRADLARIESARDVVLATRGEYRGGHPKLPRARFVYLALGGSMEQPILRIDLPQGPFHTPLSFSIPVIEVAQTRSLLTHVISYNTVLGKQPIFEIEFTGEAGRKQRVELGHFFFGAEEVYLWRNFVVCIQAEADTGEAPYGMWKSLPRTGAVPVSLDTSAVAVPSH